MGALLVLFGLSAPVAAHAAEAWLAPVDLSDAPPMGQSIDDPEIATDAQGNAVAVWRRNGVVQAASRPAGGVWSAPDNLTNVPTASTANVVPRVAVGEQGNAVVTWIAAVQRGTTQDFDSVVRAVVRPAGGSWSVPQDLSPSSGGDTAMRAGGARPAVDVQGNAVVVWLGVSNGVSAIKTADRAAGASPSEPRGGWSEPRTISATGQTFDAPQIAVGVRGDAVAVWVVDGAIQAASRAAEGTWSLPQMLGPGAGPPEVAVDARGGAVAVWRVGEKTVSAVTRSAGAMATDLRGGWSLSVDLTVAATDAATGDERFVDDPKVELDAQGNAVAVWAKRRVSKATEPITFGTIVSSVIETANRPAGASASGSREGWSATQSLTPADSNQLAPQLAMNAQGRAVSTWLRLEGTSCLAQVEACDRYFVVAATRPPGAPSDDGRGGWRAARDVGEHLDDPAPGFASPAVDGQGNAVAAWRSASGGRVQAAGFDAAGPQLRDLSVPEAGTVGSPLSFAVAPLDVWSAVASTRWDFGDGTSADGKSPSHSYAAPGSYVVTVTSTDSPLGNVSSEKRTVVVTAAPAGAPPPVAPSTAPVGETSPSPAPAGAGSTGAIATVAVTTPGSAFIGPAPAAGFGGTPSVIERSALSRCLARARRLKTTRARSKARAACARPGRVGGLKARAASARAVKLSFLAPGAVGRFAPAARRYVVKQSFKPIRSERSFRAATTLCRRSCSFAPARVGQRLELTVTDLRPRTTYYYAIKAVGAAQRTGPRSIVVKVVTR